MNAELKEESLREVRRAKKKGARNYENLDFPREDWQFEVANEDTLLGYFDWVIHNLES